MALQSFTITIGALTDAGNNGKNYVNNQPVYIKRTNGTLASIYRDLAGTSQITQDGLSNVTNSKGQFTFFVEAGDYNAEYQSQVTPITVVGADYFNSRIDETVNQIILDLSTSRGFRVQGTFAAGFTYELPNDVGLDASGNAWIYTDVDALPFTVPAATSPSSPTYTQVTFNQASNISYAENGNVEDALRKRAGHYTLAEVQASDLEVGQRVILTDRDDAPFELVNMADTGGIYYSGIAINGFKLKLRYSVYINPSWLGILPDGNDHSARLLTLDSEMPDGSLLWYKAGTYLVRDVAHTKVCTIQGKGVLFKRPDGALDSTYIMDIQGAGSTVTMVNFDSNAAGNAGHTGRCEGLRVSGHAVNVNDVDSSNTPSGGSRTGNCFYVSGDNVTLDLISSSNAGYAAIRVDGDNCDINRFRITDFEEKGIAFNGKIGSVSQKLSIRNSLECTSSSTNPNAVAGILIDSGTTASTRLVDLNLENVNVNLTGGIAGSNGIKIVNTDNVTMSNVTALQSTSNFSSVRLQERVKNIYINNLTTSGELNFDSLDFESITIENSNIAKDFNLPSPISGLYAKTVKINNTTVNGATSGSIRLENWVGQNDSDGSPAERPTFDFIGLVQNANADTVPLLFLAMSSSNVNPGNIVVAGLRVKQGRTTYTQMITGSSTTDRLIQRNLRDDSFGRVFISTSEPTAGIWKVGDTLVNPIAGAGEPKEITCTTAGTAGVDAVFKTSNVLSA